MKILVCGGAGYIGSHMVKLLSKLGYEVIVFDNLSTGHKESISDIQLIVGDLTNYNDISWVLKTQKIDLVMHFCAKSQVSESVSNPFIYYENNVVGTFNLLRAMLKNNVNKIIFSSSCAIFGNPNCGKISEEHSKIPLSPYGRTKLICEQMLQDAYLAYGLDSVCLRYFNAAGASSDLDIGESHQPETHLIPNIIASVLQKENKLKIFGFDYPTIDGTCVRDYIHVDDLAHAHYLCINYLIGNKGSHFFNLGSESGYSVLQVVDSVSRICNKKIDYEKCPRRPGDPAILIADSNKAKTILGWNPVYNNLDDIIYTAWNWHKNSKY